MSAAVLRTACRPRALLPYTDKYGQRLVRRSATVQFLVRNCPLMRQLRASLSRSAT